jgi:hypothetical protein
MREWQVKDMTRSLYEAVASGEPLIEICVRFKEGVDYDLATAAVNSLGPDIELSSGHWYGDPRLRIGAVTAEGALRLFGARFARVARERWNPQTQSYDGVYSDSFIWSATEIGQWPREVMPYLKSICVSQPGADDDGQWYMPLFDR